MESNGWSIRFGGEWWNGQGRIHKTHQGPKGQKTERCLNHYTKANLISLCRDIMLGFVRIFATRFAFDAFYLFPRAYFFIVFLEKVV